MADERCPECGALVAEGGACEDRFHLMLAWEAEYPEAIPRVHHLMVLCYHLQHPSLYSPEGLAGAKGLLVDFLDRGLTPQDVRWRDRAKLDSGHRKYKITATPERHGAYTRPVRWTLTTADVIAGGPEHYVESVRAWARSMLAALRESENLE